MPERCDAVAGAERQTVNCSSHNWRWGQQSSLAIVEDNATRATLMEGSENSWPIVASEPFTESNNHFRIRAEGISAHSIVGIGICLELKTDTAETSFLGYRMENGEAAIYLDGQEHHKIDQAIADRDFIDLVIDFPKKVVYFWVNEYYVSSVPLKKEGNWYPCCLLSKGVSMTLLYDAPVLTMDANHQPSLRDSQRRPRQSSPTRSSLNVSRSPTGQNTQRAVTPGGQTRKLFSDNLSGEGPGPGAYVSKSDFGHAAPAYTLSGRSNYKENKLEIPGPGSYTTLAPLGAASPSFSLGGRVIVPNHSTETPGPGAYEKSTSAHRATTPAAPAYSIAGRKVVLTVSTTPGPGAYDRSLVGPKSPSFSLSGRIKEQQGTICETPGPGAYDNAKNPRSKSAPSYTLGSRFKFQPNTFEETPGPGAYPLPELGKDKTAPAFTISGKKDFRIADTESPGPGAYNNQELIGKAPAWSLSGRSNPLKTTVSEVPGPGSYETAPALGRDAKAFSLSSRLPVKNPGMETPGPGSYAYKSYVTETHGPSLRSRPIASALREQESTPGPGAYEIPVKVGKEAKAFSLSGRTTSQKVEEYTTLGYTSPRGTFDGPSYTIAIKTKIPTQDQLEWLEKMKV